ncbi:glycosyltransferase [Halovenus amylolytica]|uniref:glycosyltransferase n=1 Tax=Halovenus amylolytica TaxID=2500550 RepID=UPI003D6BB375
MIPNSIGHDTFYYDPDHSTTPNTQTVLLPFRNATWKGKNEVKYIIEYIYRKYNVNIHLYGPSDACLPGYVKYYERPTDNELRRLYSNADIFVYPSWVEGFGLPPLEAMATKCAVVATNTGRIRDFPTDTIASIVPPRDTSALIDSTCELIDNRKKKKELQRSGYEYVRKYSYKEATRKLEKILMEV